MLKRTLSRIALLSAIIFAGLGTVVSSACAAVIAEHIGDADPTTEGWTFNDYTGLGGLYAGGADTEPHWRVMANTNSTGRYLFPLTSEHVNDPTGWTLTVRAKLNAADVVNQAYFGVDDGPHPVFGSLWSLNLVNNPTGPGVYQLLHPDQQGTQVSSVDPSLDYHTYKLSFNPAGDAGTGAVTFYMDDVVVGYQTRITAQIQSVLRVEWGDTWNAGEASDSQFSLVRFETGQVVPIYYPGDFNTNGSVNATDLTIWKNNFSTTTGASISTGDADGDFDVDGTDFLSWQRHFSGGAGAISIPEPLSATLLVGACAFLRRVRRRSGN